MAKRIVYIEPGDMVEVRLVRPGDERNARAWNNQTRPGKVLMRVLGSDRVAFANPAVNATWKWGELMAQLDRETVARLEAELAEAEAKGLGRPGPVQIPDVRLLGRHLGAPQPDRRLQAAVPLARRREGGARKEGLLMANPSTNTDVFTIERGYWGMLPGDGYKLISSSVISEHPTREAAMEAFITLVDGGEPEPEDLLIGKPDFSSEIMPGMGYAYPTFWAQLSKEASAALLRAMHNERRA